MNKRNSVLLFVGILCVTNALWGSTREGASTQSPANNAIPSYKQSLKELGYGAACTTLAVLSGISLFDIHSLTNLDRNSAPYCGSLDCAQKQFDIDKNEISKAIGILDQLQLAGTCGVTGYAGLTLMKKGLTGVYTRFTTANELLYERERQMNNPAASRSGH